MDSSGPQKVPECDGIRRRTRQLAGQRQESAEQTMPEFWRSVQSIVSSESRRAFVAVKAHIFRLGAHDGDLSGVPQDAQVFYSMDEAVKWIERQEDEISKS